MAGQILAASVLWIGWLGLWPSRKLAARSVFGCKPHYQTTALCAALVVPILKKGDSLTPKNYRPVALLPIFSKILEGVVFNQLVLYLDLESIIHPNHHGSRPGHSTATALIQIYARWVEEVDDGNMVGVMMVDLSAAFDMVDKLELFGLEQTALQWMKSIVYIGRSQSVNIGGCFSLER